jgi:hypothetical protein
MKNIVKILALAVLMFVGLSCQNKRLDDLMTDPLLVDVNVRINWSAGQIVPTADGMRINIFALDGAADYGKADVPYSGAPVKLKTGATYLTYAYSYIGNNVHFRNESSRTLIEAFSSPLVRSTYSGLFPDEATVGGITGSMYVGENASYTVLKTSEPQYIDVYPEDVVKKYTFEVRGVKGAEFISSTRGGISGMSASYFFATRQLAATPSTLLFDATVDVAAGTITGSFRTFGRLDAINNFTIEILFPSNTNGIMQKTWNVTYQIDDNTNYHIIIDDSGIEVPDEGGGTTGAWEVNVNEWNDNTVSLTNK